MRAIVARVVRLEAALATAVHVYDRERVAAALERLSDEQLEALLSAWKGYQAGRAFTDEERAAMRAYELASCHQETR